MTDAERVLHVLLHDLRTPIGVAQGYLRMMQEGRLTAAAETERAVTKALKALGQTARLCQDAGDFLDDSQTRLRATDVAATWLVEEFFQIARDRSLEVSAGSVPRESRLSLAGEPSETVRAVAVVLGAADSPRISIEAVADELRFVSDAADGNPAVAGAPFDPWPHGLTVAAASRRIAWSSGQIQKHASGNGLIVTFPMRNGTPATA